MPIHDPGQVTKAQRNRLERLFEEAIGALAALADELTVHGDTITRNDTLDLRDRLAKLDRIRRAGDDD